MKKNLANIISASRILAAIGLYFFSSVSGGFLALYSFCALTDLIDGPIARKTQSESAIGGTLDTVGDLATYIAMGKIMIQQKLVPWWIIVWYATAGAATLASGLIAQAKHGRYLLCHSLFGKIMGGSMFLMPFAILVIDSLVYLVICCIIASITAVESILIQIFNKQGREDPVTLYGVLKENRAEKQA